MSDTAKLSLRFVGDIAGEFYVPRYQRGYRWGAHEVQQLLDDIWENREQPYSLQPVVVKQLGADRWELVDGQQRLTTLFLILTYMKRQGLQRTDAPYVLEYETRPGSQQYLLNLDPMLRDQNIDYFHMYGAYEAVARWFQDHGPREQYAANKFYECLFERVQVIWYEAPPELDSTTLFTRLNVGRIPLTNAELVKALLLSKAAGAETNRAFEMAAQWDAIERDLRREDVWAFVSGRAPQANPTRIDLLLDTLAGGPTGRERPLFHTFDVIRDLVDAHSALDVWNRVQDLHALVRGWFEDRNLFHKIGYLVTCRHSFAELVVEAQGCTKSKFEARLDRLIAQSLDLTQEGLSELDYDGDRKKCERVLTLMNVEAVRRLRNSSERYPFETHAGTAWSLEHIHAQNAELLTRAEQWQRWLTEHADALRGLPGENPERDDLIARIAGELDDIKRDTFQQLSQQVTRMLSPKDVAESALHSVHSIANLALLSSGNNSALSNAVFEVKRQRILEMDRSGSYIPICTRRVFLKYYADADAHQVHFWSGRDRDAYFDAIRSAIEPYLTHEEID